MFTIRAEETVKVVADPPVLNQSGEWVRVSWSGVVIPQKLDWIGVWLLPNESFNIDAKHQAPVKYQVQYTFTTLTARSQATNDFWLISRRRMLNMFGVQHRKSGSGLGTSVLL